MSIEQFGESLLSDVRQRREKRERDARKRAEKEAMLGLGFTLATKVGEQVMSNKAQAFLQSEPFIANNTYFKQQLKNSQTDITDYDGDAQDPNYLVNKYLPQTLATYQAVAPASASPTDIKSQAMLAAQRMAEERKKALTKERINAARLLVEGANNDPNAYREATLKGQSKTPADALARSIGSFITGGTTHDSALATDLYSKSEAYKNLYVQDPNAAMSTVQLMQKLKNDGVTFQEANITYGERFTRKDTDFFGKTTESTAVELLQNGKTWGYQDSEGNRISYLTESQQTRQQTAQQVVPDKDAALVIEQDFARTITEDQQERLADIAVGQFGKDFATQAEADAAKQLMYGNLKINSTLLEGEMGLSPRQAMTVAAEMEIIRQQVMRGGQTGFDFNDPTTQVIGFETETNSTSVSPMLAIAAIDSLQANNVLGMNTTAYENLRKDFELAYSDPNNPNVREFKKTFKELDIPTQTDMVKFLRQFPTFTQERIDEETGEAKPSILRFLLDEYQHFNTDAILKMHTTNPYTGRSYNVK